MSAKKLKRSFYNRPTLDVAAEIIGKFIVFNTPSGKLSARIVEVEAYIGQDDPACHASRGLTKRNRPMFGPAGFTYVYFIYGMYHCLNFVTEPKDSPAAILLRAAEPVEGCDRMLQAAGKPSSTGLLSGPGKFCRAFGFTTEQNELDLTGDLIYIENRNVEVSNIQRSQRVGIREGRDLLWRFYDADSTAVSKPR
ncbi:MAG: DNA-3-methyladenine glycosylase [candidate division Zixibacteria bacterium]|nr:DNA-3-methyladenine glycosylase [candidate division Zixibacteria bacterium]MDH3936260.1 DNA-3-methyladenine glycosylase [candidate division Zixibacteria bacterium]MDH4034591.1 DNA-3-methyladenine glycosylase [candidate division Zixibacteria bacterium]